ncbi:LOW QUALITY PROTEIN: uncharacterized protein LOC110406946 [Numida meleagris]|uniref:LOW QUALITY PROTEIN: uncharacterized protein LOC110406946 n=1 Tax=Numida meleagris TaxID=8996 RepID=UPI000B3E2116|nr:LOW QUALITY PROTEIN: uncharacterized protein LOC110406946 [Numida meleagris]
MQVLLRLGALLFHLLLPFLLLPALLQLLLMGHRGCPHRSSCSGRHPVLWMCCNVHRPAPAPCSHPSVVQWCPSVPTPSWQLCSCPQNPSPGSAGSGLWRCLHSFRSSLTVSLASRFPLGKCNETFPRMRTLFPGQLQRERGDWRCRELPMVLPLFPKLRLFEDTFLMVKYFRPYEIEQKHPGHVSPSGSSGQQQPALGQVVLGPCPGAASGPSQLPDSCQPRARAAPACAMGTRSSGYVPTQRGLVGAWAAGLGEGVGAAAVLLRVCVGAAEWG